jgi:hypothetical protein
VEAEVKYNDIRGKYPTEADYDWIIDAPRVPTIQKIFLTSKKNGEIQSEWLMTCFWGLLDKETTNQLDEHIDGVSRTCKGSHR